MTNELAIRILTGDVLGTSKETHEAIKMAVKALSLPDVSDRKVGEWIVVERHEHYPSGKPYEQVQCPFCKRFDNNGDGSFCGYCGARMER